MAPESLEKILYVEDDDSIAEIVLMTLRGFAGFKLLHCNSGPKALAEADMFMPQLILMDVMMPHMDGIETMICMRQSRRMAEVPYIFMTAKAQVHEQKSYMEHGALGVIVKPFDPMTLGERLESYWQDYFTLRGKMDQGTMS